MEMLALVECILLVDLLLPYAGRCLLSIEGPFQLLSNSFNIASR